MASASTTLQLAGYRAAGAAPSAGAFLPGHPTLGVTLAVAMALPSIAHGGRKRLRPSPVAIGNVSIRTIRVGPTAPARNLVKREPAGRDCYLTPGGQNRARHSSGLR